MTELPSIPPVMTDRERSQLFNRLVRPSLVGARTEHDQPLYVAIGGQPGIGKTTAQTAVRRTLS
ncbi:hypothetical protein AB4Z54_25495, partial [Streptomyces sp. MCAF7]